SAAVLLMAYGSPDSPEQMEEFLRNVFRGRPVSEATVREFQERYRLFGGRSPLLDVSLRQARALEKMLGMTVRVGMRHWRPTIRDAAKDLGDPIVGLPLAPQYSRFSVGEYHRALKEATSSRLILVESWHRQPKFLEAWLERIGEGLERHSPDVLLFTAHSVPEDPVDPYARHVQETVHAILPMIPAMRWEFAYQSASSAPLKWLGPDVDTRLKELRARGHRKVMAVPVSFISDHAEVLYDLDHLHRRSAEALGMILTRCESLNDHPLLIGALADVVREVL
ncbi:MAG: ferrochelatase, partial [Acidobacteria bacterium]|nr:ferrochelatase [Acidobacteriota bacterium]